MSENINYHADGTISIEFDGFGLNWDSETPEYVEVEYSNGDDSAEWPRSYVLISELESFVSTVKKESEDIS